MSRKKLIDRAANILYREFGASIVDIDFGELMDDAEYHLGTITDKVSLRMIEQTVQLAIRKAIEHDRQYRARKRNDDSDLF